MTAEFDSVFKDQSAKGHEDNVRVDPNPVKQFENVTLAYQWGLYAWQIKFLLLH